MGKSNDSKPYSRQEELLFYPRHWEAEYRASRMCGDWKQHAELFQHAQVPSKRGLYGFAQYALQHLLRHREGVRSVCFFYLASKSPKEKYQLRQDIVRERMGLAFAALQAALQEAGFTSYRGEPDLFCWSDAGDWFFVEAKRGDALKESQRRWHEVFHRTLPERQRIRVIRLMPTDA